MIFIQRAEEPEILKTKGKAKQLALLASYAKGKRKLSFYSTLYAHETVKQTLQTMQHGKCCFCESHYRATSYGHVEHFRPKAGFKQKSSDKLQKPGYYWLAYTWENLLMSCQLCNQQYKKNLFPLLHPDKRALSHHDDIAAEQPLLINPTLSNPQDFIGFRAEIPFAIDDNVYGKTTIAALGLDREALNEDRRSKLADLEILLDLVKIADKQGDNLELQKLADKAERSLQQAVLAMAEYSAMANAYIGDFFGSASL